MAPSAPLPIGPRVVALPPPPVRVEATPQPPADLTLLVRINDPQQLVRELATLVPPHTASLMAQLDAPQVVTLLLGHRLGALVDLAQPIDIASLGAEDSSFVVSLAVRPEAESRVVEGLAPEEKEEKDGLQHLVRREDHDGGRLRSCAVARAAGHATLRLVCASDDLALEAAARYLARGVAAEPFDADARLTMPGRILATRRGAATKALGEAASVRLGTELVEALVGEIDRMDADVRFSAKHLEVSVDLRLAARESLLARVLVPRARISTPPRAFFRLPADSLFAMHTTGATAEDIAPLRRALAESLEASLVQDGYQPQKTRVLREHIEALFMTGGPLVFGLGISGSRDALDKALTTLDGATRPVDVTRAEAQVRSALAGWVIAEVDEPAERWTRGLREVVKQSAEADRTRTPGSRSSHPLGPDDDHIDVRVGSLDATLRLPKDALHLEVLLSPVTKGKRPSRRAHVLVVPRGSSTWLGYSEDLAGLASRLRIAVDDTLEPGTLSRSAEANTLRTRPALAAGFTSVGGMALLLGKTRTTEELRELGKTSARIVSLSSHGTEAVTWSVTDDTTPPGIHLAARFQLGRRTATDLVQLLGL